MSLRWEIFTLSPVAHITVDFKKVVSDLLNSPWFHFGKKRMYHEKNEAIEIASTHNNNVKAFPYARR